MPKRRESLPLPNISKLTLLLPSAAEYTDSSISTFRRRFIASGLVKLIDMGGRSPHVLRSELDAAVLKIAADQARDPSLVKARSGGAALKERGVVGNKWGRVGKPAAERKAARKS